MVLVNVYIAFRGDEREKKLNVIPGRWILDEVLRVTLLVEVSIRVGERFHILLLKIGRV